jgi:protein-tyrosine phosphatase
MVAVLPYLYISSYSFASNFSSLQADSITHIVNLTDEFQNQYPDDFRHLRISVKDRLSERPTRHFHNIASFAASAKSSGGKYLVHCAEGVLRSATGVLACLIINEGMRLGHHGRCCKA